MCALLSSKVPALLVFLFSEKRICTHKQHAVVAREELADLRGVIWLGLCAASSVTIHFSHPLLQCTVLAKNVTRQQGRGNGGAISV